MANKKRQHFVSQFLLRNFSSESNNKTIYLFNKNTGKSVRDAPIRSQAQESYFYGIDPTFEDYLSLYEGKSSEVIKDIIATGSLPDRTEKANSFLLHFVMMYAFRTKSSVFNTEERINSSFKTIAKYDKELSQIDFSTHRIKHPEPAAFNLAYNIDNWVITGDLNLLLLQNQTASNFILSDNPFVQFNPILLSNKDYPNNGGLLSKGLIIFFPLSPKFCLMYYDPLAYALQNGDRDTLCLNVQEDVDNINLLQAIASDKILYYGNLSENDYVLNLGLKSRHLKKDIYVNEEIPHPTKPNSFVLLSYYLEHTNNPNFSYFSLTEEAKNRIGHIGMNEFRNQEIVDWVQMDKTQLRNRYKS
ncbi:DUF4238 domain-containing protein [Winogradskyella maritima]|uniref:DUF4238 domain-containing protein n=1 Tax=Winogradskyella maritima TaxID=1517766 RepID=A0ABV8AGY1_9FLAO|nr:DUF4238 domain-containing protein [Winogradskyella maritima]